MNKKQEVNSEWDYKHRNSTLMIFNVNLHYFSLNI